MICTISLWHISFSCLFQTPSFNICDLGVRSRRDFINTCTNELHYNTYMYQLHPIWNWGGLGVTPQSTDNVGGEWRFILHKIHKCKVGATKFSNKQVLHNRYWHSLTQNKTYLAVAHDPNVLANPIWHDENVECKHLMRVFATSMNVDRKSKQKHGLWNEVNHKTFWKIIYGGLYMGRIKGVWSWAYAHVVVPHRVCQGHFGVQIDLSIIPCTNANLRQCARVRSYLVPC